MEAFKLNSSSVKINEILIFHEAFLGTTQYRLARFLSLASRFNFDFMEIVQITTVERWQL